MDAHSPGIIEYLMLMSVNHLSGQAHSLDFLLSLSYLYAGLGITLAMLVWHAGAAYARLTRTEDSSIKQMK